MQRNGLLCCLLLSSTAFSLPFNIVPKAGTALPTTVTEGAVVTALYTISNASKKTLNHNHIQYLPPHVIQVTQNPNISDLCGSSFNLMPQGTSGDSCTLQLSIDGEVFANDPDPHHHLFACLPGEKTCAGTRSPLDVRQLPGVQQFVAAGSQQNTQGIVFTSQDQGKTWKFQALPYPESTTNSTFYGSSCTNLYCALSGVYGTDTTTEPGVAINSVNTPLNWSQTIFTAAQPNQFQELLRIDCHHNHCVSVGLNQQDNTVSPLITQSLDAGQSWTQQILNIINPEIYSGGILITISCSGSFCAGGGVYLPVTNDQEYASVAYSTNHGETWAQQVLPLASGSINNQLSGISCEGISCIAVGTYTDDVTQQARPGIAITTNAGETWTNNVINELPTPYSLGAWTAVSCTSGFCVAVGYYSNTNYAGYLGVATSSNFGLTWNQQALPIPPNTLNLINGTLNDVKCSDNLCIAVGNYYSNDYTAYPVIATSTDAGQTWTQQIYENYPNTPLYGIG